MKFNTYIGNPPYQYGNRSIYQYFIRQALDISNNACLIVNNNWLTGKTHQETRKTLVNGGIETVINYAKPGEIFPAVHVAVSIIKFSPHSLPNRTPRFIQGEVEQTISFDSDYSIIYEIDPKYIGNNGSRRTSSLKASIVDKVLQIDYGNTWDLAKNARLWSIASNGFHMYNNYTEDIYNWYTEDELKSLGFSISDFAKVAFLDASKQLYFKYTTLDSLIKGREAVGIYKVICGSKAQTTPNVLSNIHILQPGEICTNSFGIVGLAETKEQAEFIYKYTNTKFFRYLVLQAISGLKVSFGTGCTKYVPLIRESEQEILVNLSIREIDQYLYNKYGFSIEEINVIEKTVS